MLFLPDEIWSKILAMGVATSRIGHRDLCSVAIACRRFHRLSGDPSLWSILLSQDFPPSVSSSSSDAVPSKSFYKTKFERDKARRHAAWKRIVLNAESQAAVCRRRLKDMEDLIEKEGERMKMALNELSNIEKARQASVALNVWQPEIVRGRQRQLVEQCVVPIESRLRNLKMEIELCKKQIATYRKAHNEQKRLLKESEETLLSMKYSPLEIYRSNVTGKDSVTRRNLMKRNKK